MHPNLVVVSILVIAQVVCGWLLVFKTDMLVRWGRDNYAKSKLVQASPNSNLVFKPWYPTLLRAAGIFIWVFDIAFLCIVILATRGH
jgi:hypothetical protein